MPMLNDPWGHWPGGPFKRTQGGPSSPTSRKPQHNKANDACLYAHPHKMFISHQNMNAQAHMIQHNLFLTKLRAVSMHFVSNDCTT